MTISVLTFCLRIYGNIGNVRNSQSSINVFFLELLVLLFPT